MPKTVNNKHYYHGSCSQNEANLTIAMVHPNRRSSSSNNGALVLSPPDHKIFRRLNLL